MLWEDHTFSDIGASVESLGRGRVMAVLAALMFAFCPMRLVSF